MPKSDEISDQKRSRNHPEEGSRAAAAAAAAH
jgi:hypothetical protein